MPEIILTTDRTLMSTYRHRFLLGFGASSPPNPIPDLLFFNFLFPKVRHKNGIPIQAKIGLRKIEAALLEKGFDVLTVDPDHLESYLSEAKILGISAMDPLGWGPSSATWRSILKTGDPLCQRAFRELVRRESIQRARRERGLKVVVGGAGWQFGLKPDMIDQFGIDCVVEGEGEIAVPKLFKRILEGEEVPKYYKVPKEEIPSAEEIPNIKNPTIGSFVEIGRGCPRGCKFCTVTLLPLRWHSLEYLEREFQVNAPYNEKDECLLHAEDVLLYGSRNIYPKPDKFLRLIKLAKKYNPKMFWSHITLAAALTEKKMVEKAMDIICQDQEYLGVEIGIETGSPQLAKKVMPGKAKPFEAERWPEVVKEGLDFLNDVNIVPYCTFIVGMPGEREEDVIATMDLVEDLKDNDVVLVPLFFVPWRELETGKWFKYEHLSERQKEFLKKCFDHDLRFVDRFIFKWLKHIPFGFLFYPFYRFGRWRFLREAGGDTGKYSW